MGSASLSLGRQVRSVAAASRSAGAVERAKQLRDDGVISDAEFGQMKAKALA